MASFVLLLKEYEDEAAVIYKFGPSDHQMGRIKFDKKTTIISEVEPVPDSEQSPNFYFKRAAQRLARCIAEGGSFPDKMCFAS
jgi:hypothetical protein